MVVEDDMVLRELYSDMLSLAGMEVVASMASGLSAIEFIKEGNRVDLIIMDYRMPVLNGIETMKEIRKFCPDVPVIFATADDVMGITALDAGATIVLVKPFAMEHLMNAVKKLNK